MTTIGRGALIAGALLAMTACSKSEPAAPSAKLAVQQIRYEDGHIRFVEYTLYPGANTLGAVPYSSVVMTDAAWPEVMETLAAGAAAVSEMNSAIVTPTNVAYPKCRVESPRAAKVVTVTGDFPQHYYRVEYKRVDGKDYPANWKTWYADVFAPPATALPDLGETLKGKDPLSKEWPFNAKYSALAAAPANHTLRYADDHVELIEVAIRPGEVENMHGHPYPSVYADDGGFAPAGSSYSNRSIVEGIGPPWGELTAPFDSGTYPICFSAIPEPPHQVTVKSGPPQHFYRIHFKRMDGEDVKSQWRSWYPEQ